MTTRERQTPAPAARVLFVVPLFAPHRGGIETLSAHLLPELRARGHEFCVVSRHGYLDLADAEVIDGIEVHRLDMHTAFDDGPRSILELEQGLATIKKTFQPDVVHIHDVDVVATWFHVRTRHAWDAPELLTLHGVFTGYPWAGETVLARLVDGSAWISGVSNAALAAVQELVPSVEGRSSVIPNGLLVPDVAPRPYPVRPVFVCVGRLERQKGFDVALAALALIDSVEDPRLVIVGSGSEGGELRRRAAALGIGKQVHFAGSLSHRATLEIIASCSTVIVPSRALEGFSLAALEAALLARPVVASDVGGLGETVVDDETGIVVPPDDPPALATALGRLVAEPALVSTLGGRARERALEEYSLDRCVDAYDALYRRLASAGR